MTSHEELGALILEPWHDMRPDGQSNSDTSPESDIPQSCSKIARQVASASSGDTSQDQGSYFTGPLGKRQKRKMTSEFVGDIHITLDTQDENMRAQNSLLPKRFYRTFYENSATLSSYVTVDTHVKHRKRKDLKLDHHKAFQAIGEFSIERSMFQEAIRRHLIWNQKQVPSTYISVFNSLRYAKERACFLYDESERIAQRVGIAQIRTDHLIPATIRGLCKSTISILTNQWHDVKFKEYTQHIDIPVWIHKKAKEQHGSKITPKQWKESGADMWILITELQLSNLLTVHPKIPGMKNTIKGKGHNYEWLCCGAIPKSMVMDVWPWDGKRLYFKGPGRPVRSFENSGQTWVWHWEKKMWLPDTFSASANAAQVEHPSIKRQRIDDAASQDKDKIDFLEGSHTHQTLSMSIIQPTIEVHPGDPTFTYIPKTCENCNHPTERTLFVKPPRPVGLHDNYPSKKKWFRPY